MMKFANRGNRGGKLVARRAPGSGGQTRSPHESNRPGQVPGVGNQEMQGRLLQAERTISETGKPLESNTREFMEARFGTDFSGVRVHADAHAVESAEALNASAYAIGNDIVFGAGQYAPQNQAGRHLLAHELTHTLQQGGAPTAVARKPAPAPPKEKDFDSPRFKGNAFLKKVLNGKHHVTAGDTDKSVRLIQESLLAEGYVLPERGADGIFGPETKAVIIQFQKDATAKKETSGIVGPETMELLDLHDPENLKGPGAIQQPGPLPGARPTPATSCDDRFSSIGSMVTNATGAGASPAANVTVELDGSKPFMKIAGANPAKFQPRVTILAPSDAAAAKFEVGFISSVQSLKREAHYRDGSTVRDTLPKLPIRDAFPRSKGVYDAVFVESATPHVLETFRTKYATVNLIWPDTPSDFFYLDLVNEASCAGGKKNSVMKDVVMHDDFRTWVAMRHKPSGCVHPLHHIDWTYLVEADADLSGSSPKPLVKSNKITVTEPNGDGSPKFIQGDPVGPEVLVNKCV